LQGDRGHANAKLGQVPFQEGTDEILPPRLAFGSGAGQKRRREPASYPKPFERLGAHFVQRQAAQVMVMDATGQRLGRLSQEIGRGTAQHQKARRQGPAVRQHAQHRKKIRAALDFIQHDKAAQRFESQQGVVKARQVPGISRSNTVAGPGRLSTSCRARVVLPTCLAPRMATTG